MFVATFWTPEEDDALSRMVSDGNPVAQIARALKKTTGSVSGRCHRLKISIGAKRPPRPVKSAQQIADTKPPFTIPFKPTEFECRRVPMSELAAGDCRWAVNHADEGEQHLFCGNSVMEGQRYCRPHFKRSIGPGTPAERRATKDLERARA